MLTVVLLTAGRNEQLQQLVQQRMSPINADYSSGMQSWTRHVLFLFVAAAHWPSTVKFWTSQLLMLQRL